jgi:hypothetical protein
MAYRNYYLQGRFIRAYETCNKPEFLEIIKSFVTYYNPIQIIKQYYAFGLNFHIEKIKCNPVIDEEIKEIKLNNKINRQIIVEECIDVFEGINRTNFMNINDAYQILCSSLCLMDIHNETKNYIKFLLNTIHKSSYIMSDILKTEPISLYYNTMHINSLMNIFLKSNPNDILKEKIILIYLTKVNNINCTSDLILKDFDPLNVKTKCDHKKLELVIQIALSMAKSQYTNRYNYSISELEKVLTSNVHLLEAKIELAIWCSDNKSTFYNVEEAAKILYNFLNNYTIKPLAKIMLTNKFNFIDNNIVFNMLENLNETDILNQFYEQNITESPQKIVIANNSKYDVKIIVKLIHDSFETYNLKSNEKIKYNGLREKNILHIGLQIIHNSKILLDHKYLDIHSYIAIFVKNNKLVAEIYYEDDKYLDELDPTDEMIKDIAAILQKSFINEKVSYPNTTYDEFMKLILENFCCKGRKCVDYYYLFPKLNSLMRRPRWISAIEIITGFNMMTD